MKTLAVRTRNRPALQAIAKPVLSGVVLLALAAPVRACPMCKDSTVTVSVDQSSTPGARIYGSGLSFNKSIYFMLGGLFGVMGFTGRVMYRAVKSQI
jgi:hypothetical protein